jgi:hypothetical protein
MKNTPKEKLIGLVGNENALKYIKIVKTMISTEKQIAVSKEVSK